MSQHFFVKGKKMRKIIVLGLAVMFFTGCASVKTSWHGGRLNIVRVSQEKRLEKRSWDYTVAKFQTDPTKVAQPETISGTRDFVQKAYESGPHRNLQVGGFYNRNSNLVVYITGEYAILVHEYCHALINQLKINVTHEQNEYFCALMKREYQDRQKRYEKARNERFIK
jgi:hypothetical protein